MTISIDLTRKILNELIEHKNWLGDIKQEISKILFNGYFSYEILSVFKGKPDDQKDFISEGVISKFISTFSDNDIDIKQEIRDKIDLLLDFKEITSINTLQILIQKLDELLKGENQKKYREEKENFMACIEDVIESFLDKIMNISDVSILNSFAGTIVEGIEEAEKWSEKRIYIYACLILTDVCQDSVKSDLDDVIHDFFSDADVEDARFVFNKYKDHIAKEELLKKYQAILQERVIEQKTFLDLLYPVAAEDSRTQWLITLINDVPESALTKLEELNHKVDNKKTIVSALLKKSQQVPVQQKSIFYNAVNKMKCANDATLRTELASQIKALLNSDDLHSQQVGYGALKNASYLSESLKREIARETVERLRSLTPEQARQPDSVSSILLYWDSLESPVKRDFLDFVFDKLIKRSADINDIIFGIEILSKTKPKYENYSLYFDDIFTRSEEESDTKVKSTLIEGLKNLKPQITNKRNEEFWTKVTNLKQNIEDSRN